MLDELREKEGRQKKDERALFGIIIYWVGFFTGTFANGQGFTWPLTIGIALGVLLPLFLLHRD